MRTSGTHTRMIIQCYFTQMIGMIQHVIHMKSGWTLSTLLTKGILHAGKTSLMGAAPATLVLQIGDLSSRNFNLSLELNLMDQVVVIAITVTAALPIKLLRQQELHIHQPHIRLLVHLLHIRLLVHLLHIRLLVHLLHIRPLVHLLLHAHIALQKLLRPHAHIALLLEKERNIILRTQLLKHFLTTKEANVEMEIISTFGHTTEEKINDGMMDQMEPL